MTNGDLKLETLNAITPEAFAAIQPFPWIELEGLLSLDAWQELYATFPALDLFERHVGRPRTSGQRPHDRYYLAYEASIYDDSVPGGADHRTRRGVVQHDKLAKPWQHFLDRVRNTPYRSRIAQLLGVENPTLRFAWHVGVTGSEVSPHRDARRKVGTHIFYFNTHADWNSTWGGATLVLGGRTVDHDHPDFGDFTVRHAVDSLGNKSFLFRRTDDSWHGVEALTCPAGHYRRLFNVIFETCQEPP